ncbi:MAG: hypothetical protein KTR13_04230 [Saprospiraceae bacterium]|nr:hypothetical protein [Saprospiraceae bacterium]
MKKYLLFLLALPFLWVSCSDDDNSFGIEELSYDGPNEAAPILPLGTFEAAARFPASITSDYSGRSLDVVQFYLENVPLRTWVKVYGDGGNNAPGTLLYEREVTDDVFPFRWNSHSLDIPVTINGDDLWIAIVVEHENGNYGSIGCDPGPATSNGDWFLDVDFTTNWETFRNFTNNAVSINWNIRGELTN